MCKFVCKFLYNESMVVTKNSKILYRDTFSAPGILLGNESLQNACEAANILTDKS